MKRRKKLNESTINTEDFLIPYGVKKSILALFLLTFGIILAFSIISYTRSDFTYIQNLKLTDFFALIDRNSDISISASKISNWFGLIGAILAHFFINDLFGYFSFSFVIVLTYWGILILFGNNDFRNPTFYSIIILSIGVLLSSMMGILANNLDIISQNKEIYGSVGFLLGSLLIKLIGSAGGLIIIFIMILIFATILLNIDLKELLTNTFIQSGLYVKAFWFKLKGIFKKKQIDNEQNIVIKKNKDKVIPKKDEETKETRIEIIKEKVVNNNDVTTKEKKSEITESKKQQNQNQRIIENEEKTHQNIEEKSVGFQPWDESLPFKTPPLNLLDPPIISETVRDAELKQKAEMIKNKLQLFNVDIQEIKISPGPVITTFEVIPAPSVKVNAITSLKDDIALALKAKGLRLIAPMPGRGSIGIEIPNDNPEVVKVSNIFGSEKFNNCNYDLPIALGKNTTGEIFIEDLYNMPHLLIAGTTGSGKSVGINTIINSLIFKLHPAKLKFVIIDPKRIELTHYKKLRKHYLAVCPDVKEEIITSSDNIITVFKSLEAEMDLRYDLFSKLNSRNIKEYNEKVANIKNKEKDGVEFHPLPYIVVTLDEFAELMQLVGRQIEDSVARLAQMSRAAGIHLILATQRPSTDILRGSIKANFPARIVYKVSAKVDSMTIIGQTGAEQLLGRGDMLVSINDIITRVQNAYISEQEIYKILDFIEQQEGFTGPYMLPSISKRSNKEIDENFDALIYDAAVLILRNRIASVTFLQRKLKLGYARAARIMDELEQLGVVGPLDGGKNRLVLIDTQEELDQIMDAYNIQRTSSFV